MPNGNPTGANQPVKITVAPGHVAFLREVFSTAAVGRRSDAAIEPDSPHNATREAEADAFDALRLCTSTYTLTPTPAVRRALAETAAAVDASNEYDRVRLEHTALHGLLDQLTENGVRG